MLINFLWGLKLAYWTKHTQHCFVVSSKVFSSSYNVKVSQQPKLFGRTSFSSELFFTEGNKWIDLLMTMTCRLPPFNKRLFRANKAVLDLTIWIRCLKINLNCHTRQTHVYTQTFDYFAAFAHFTIVRGKGDTKAQMSMHSAVCSSNWVSNDHKKKRRKQMESESRANGCKSYKTGLVHRLYKADLFALVCDV